MHGFGGKGDEDEPEGHGLQPGSQGGGKSWPFAARPRSAIAPVPQALRSAAAFCAESFPAHQIRSSAITCIQDRLSPFFRALENPFFNLHKSMTSMESQVADVVEKEFKAMAFRILPFGW